MKWKDFLNPRSMLTPGVAGSVVMVIANTMWVEFMIPQKWTALVLSFIIIIPILMQFAASFIENIIYFMFNGLIIFALAVNTNFAGRKLQDIVTSDKKAPTQEVVAAVKAPPSSLVLEKIHGMQLASNNQQDTATDGTQASGETSKKDSSDQKDNKDSAEKEAKNKSKNQEGREFFQPWF
ncbi:hypothetical protein [Legionella lansingensis]|nr:hypothetical protein [Legionella lansingensis]